MPAIAEYHVPQYGANDDEVLITEIFCRNGDKISKGDLLGSFEGSKISFEIEAEAEGYFHTPYEEGNSIATNALFCIVSQEESPVGWEALFAPSEADEIAEPDVSPTKKALLLIRKHGLNTTDIPFAGERLSEQDVSAYMERTARTENVGLKIPTDRKGTRVAIIGAGPSAPVLIDAMELGSRLVPTVIFDDDRTKTGTKIHGVTVAGPISESSMRELYEKGAFQEVVIAINSSVELRAHFYEKMKKFGFPLANVVHPKANISPMARLGEGNVILQFCNVSPQATIGNNNYLSAYTSIEHDSALRDNCSFGPGVMTSGNVSIGSKVKFGTGVFIEPHLHIGSNSTIASGAILIRDVADNTVVKSRELLDHRAK
jgi:sugar O-acyltransferase (sialic acid O-acetyltransferase NeuD family)